MLCEEHVWILQGFDLSTWNLFTPYPGAFKTEQEVKDWIEVNKQIHKKTVVYTYRRVGLGRFVKAKTTK